MNTILYTLLNILLQIQNTTILLKIQNINYQFKIRVSATLKCFFLYFCAGAGFSTARQVSLTRNT